MKKRVKHGLISCKKSDGRRNNRSRLRQKAALHRKPSPHIFLKERWVVIPPGEKSKPLAYLSEERATYIAMAMANNLMESVEIDHQVLRNGEWISEEE